ncbi:hypothetical protein [Roseateles sp.]|uniref:hypothetical protein n=1 Tax=Roseateles sp. TaxID=1971397 RepID=UPI0039EC1EF6
MAGRIEAPGGGGAGGAGRAGQVRLGSAGLRWALGLALLAAALGLGTAVWRQLAGLAEPSAHGSPVAGVQQPAREAPQAVTMPGLAAAGVSTTSAATSAPAGPAVDGAQVPPEGMEVCGIGQVTAGMLQSWLADAVGAKSWLQAREAELQQRVDTGLARIAARLAAGNESQQVAARLLMGDVEGAALLAARGRNAGAYQMALQACGSARAASPPNCAGLSAQRWIELDPSDARPWLRLMDEARSRGDAQAVDAALAEAAVRPRLSDGGYLLEAHVVQLLDLMPDVLTRAQALIKVIGMDGAMTGYEVAAPIKPCHGDELRRPQRLQHCQAVGRQTLAASSSLLDAQLAQKVAERAGVPPEQQAYGAATLKAAQGAWQEMVFAGIGVDCGSMARMNEISVKRAAQGELSMALSLLPAEATPRPVAGGMSR